MNETTIKLGEGRGALKLQDDATLDIEVEEVGDFPTIWAQCTKKLSADELRSIRNWANYELELL